MLTVDIFCWFKLISGPRATNNLHDICHLAMSWQTETMWMNTQWLHCSPLPCSSSNTVVCHHSVSLQSCFYSGITPWAINRTMATGQHCDDTGKQVNEFSFPCFTLTMAGLLQLVRYTIKGVVGASLQVVEVDTIHYFVLQTCSMSFSVLSHQLLNTGPTTKDLLCSNCIIQIKCK